MVILDVIEEGKGRYSSSWKPHLRATGRHLPYWITQCYLPPDTSERAPPNPSHAGWYSIYLPQRDGRLSWPSWLDSAPAGDRTSDLSITSPTPNCCTTKTLLHLTCNCVLSRHNNGSVDVRGARCSVQYWDVHRTRSTMESCLPTVYRWLYHYQYHSAGRHCAWRTSTRRCTCTLLLHQGNALMFPLGLDVFDDILAYLYILSQVAFNKEVSMHHAVLHKNQHYVCRENSL